MADLTLSVSEENNVPDPVTLDTMQVSFLSLLSAHGVTGAFVGGPTT